MANATTDIKQPRIIKNAIEITYAFDRVSGQETEHVNYTILTDPASEHMEIATYKDAEDNEEVVVSDLILPFTQAKVLKDLLNSPQEYERLKAFLNRPDVSEYLV